MSYVIYDQNNLNQIVELTRWKRSYKSMAAAKAAVTRSSKAYWQDCVRNNTAYQLNQDPQFTYGIAESEHYHAKLERQVERVNLMTGKKYMESVNTPYYCSPSSESYWSM
jgi:hypothetical protein